MFPHSLNSYPFQAGLRKGIIITGRDFSRWKCAPNGIFPWICSPFFLSLRCLSCVTIQGLFSACRQAVVSVFCHQQTVLLINHHFSAFCETDKIQALTASALRTMSAKCGLLTHATLCVHTYGFCHCVLISLHAWILFADEKAVTCPHTY